MGPFIIRADCLRNMRGVYLLAFSFTLMVYLQLYVCACVCVCVFACLCYTYLISARVRNKTYTIVAVFRRRDINVYIHKRINAPMSVFTFLRVIGAERSRLGCPDRCTGINTRHLLRI